MEENNWIRKPNYGAKPINFADDFAQKLSLDPVTMMQANPSPPNQMIESLPPKATNHNSAHERIKQARNRAARIRSRSRGRIFFIHHMCDDTLSVFLFELF